MENITETENVARIAEMESVRYRRRLTKHISSCGRNS